MPQESSKNHLKNVLSALALVGSFLLGAWAMEDRYAHASDFIQFQQQQESNFNQIRKETKGYFDSFRKQMLEDELFELELKEQEGTASNIEKAKIQRIKRQLKDL